MTAVNYEFNPSTSDRNYFDCRFRFAIVLCLYLTIICSHSIVQSDDPIVSQHLDITIKETGPGDVRIVDTKSGSTTTYKPDYDSSTANPANGSSRSSSEVESEPHARGRVVYAKLRTGPPDNILESSSRKPSIEDATSSTTSKPSTTQIASSDTTSKATIKLHESTGSTTTTTTTTTRSPEQNDDKLTKLSLMPSISDKKVVVEERDISYFLEGHSGHNMHEARSFFTDEQLSKSLFIAMNELCEYPERLRFAYLVRLFVEMGRKVASRANLLVADITGLLKRMPDDLGNKPDTSMMMDLIATSFESKSERQIPDTNQTISELIGQDDDKKRVYNSSVDKSSQSLANILSYVAYNVTKTCIRQIDLEDDAKMSRLSMVLNEAIKKGSNQMVNEMKSLDKFSLSIDAENLMNQIVKKIGKIIKSDLTSNEKPAITSIGDKKDKINSKLADLNHLSDSDGFVGSWHNYLFSNLGSAERVVKLFASLLHRVPNNSKTKYINMYAQSALIELHRTLSGFVSMQTYPYKSNYSESILLNPSKEARLLPSKMDELRKNYSLDKERLPARCYLAGRRWRLVVARALREYPQMNDVIKKIADSVTKWTSQMLKEDANDINYKLCLPKLEAGLLGWGINGDPQDIDHTKTQFPFKNPLERLTTIRDPFYNGFELGYKLGFEVGYNEERNATLELDMTNNDQQIKSSKQPDILQKTPYNSRQPMNQDPKASSSNALPSIDYVSRLSYRKACTASAKRVFPIALQEGYLTSMKISIIAGLRIVSESGSIVGAMRGKTFGSQEGRQIGRMTADSVILNAVSVPETLQNNLTSIGESQGLAGGTDMGAIIGAMAGQEGAIEAYLQTVLSGGQLRYARFHMKEYIRGGKEGFDHGLDVGKRVASSADLDPSAPRQIKYSKPETGKFNTDLSNSWQDLMPAINDTVIDAARYDANHIIIDGKLKGKYRFKKEVKRGLTRINLTNQTQDVEIDLHGFIHNDIAYLNMNGSVDNQGKLHGTIAAARILNLKDWQ